MVGATRLVVGLKVGAIRVGVGPIVDGAMAATVGLAVGGGEAGTTKGANTGALV